MTELAGLAADARQFAVRMIDEIRQRDERGAEGTQPERAKRQIIGARNADKESQRRQMIGRDPRSDQWRDEASGEPGIPGWRLWKYVWFGVARFGHRGNISRFELNCIV